MRPQDLPGYSHALSLFTCRIYRKRFRAVIGLCFVMQTHPRLRPYMRFLFVRPEVCPLGDLLTPKIRLSSDSASRRTPLPLASPSHCRADSGLSPYRTCAHRAHIKKSPADWRDFLLCWHYLSSRQVALQVLSARMSLTSVFGMGTGGPSSQSIPTSLDGFYTIIYVKTLVQVLTAYLISFLVTRTGFEPMLKA